MKKTVFVILVLLLANSSVFSQLQSPEKFLGYPLGEKYTPHHKIVSYFNHVASNSPLVKLISYGETNEGRPLLAAFISAENNIRDLERIRMNNLRLANIAKDRMAADTAAPAIVWLSYNVHGNETSSSEAALLTIYELVNPGNSQTKEWLKNTVVVIDPCINPDGRDRYVNWFNSVVGKQYNPQLYAREHREPWPGGRTNHYNFDLNRDWAWQTQLESRQRLKLYQQWYPQIHVDYHEQGINNPYYFAPAAQPYHEIITAWQRDFQQSIGKNNAKYFDKNGWLYFTKEVFDLYYPSYGDTYPIYNGAIGMTYEQAGGGSAGRGVLKREGDTLTLYDRLIHHYTSGMSTIEISSLHAGRLISEFRNFFNNALSKGTGNYKTYVIKHNAAQEQNLNSLMELLDKNNIEYHSGSGSGRGYNYATGKDETFSIGARDIVISSLQPKSTLISVLFDPQPKLVDTATYDITAWALPYVYGVTAYAVKDKINVSSAYKKADPVQNTPVDTYGYVIPWEGLKSARVTGQLLQKGIRLRFAKNDFEINGVAFKRGAVLVLKTSNNSLDAAGLWKLTTDIANAENVKIYPVSTGFVDKGYDFGSRNVAFMKAPRAILLSGTDAYSNAAGEVWHFMEQELDYPVTLVNSNDLGRITWSEVDVLILADGNYSFLTDKKQWETVKSWVSQGGKIIALENAVAGLAKATEELKFKKDEDDSTEKKDKYAALKIYENQERDYISGMTPGSVYKVDMDITHPLAFGYPATYYTLKMDNNVYEFIDNGWNVGVIKKDNLLSGFVGARLKKKLNDGVVFGVQGIGRGNIVYLADNVLFRNFWQNGKLLFTNALFLVGQ
ncbi:MAG: zinc carboxypeptidase [Chitinophagaceae bacterium]|nr:zinc carboxypeptidase [Chitinophagaceae bacterium]MCW5927621.1 zinc carboxypeptidase [Chitinophagaceae bacterium]